MRFFLNLFSKYGFMVSYFESVVKYWYCLRRSLSVVLQKFHSHIQNLMRTCCCTESLLCYHCSLYLCPYSLWKSLFDLSIFLISITFKTILKPIQLVIQKVQIWMLWLAGIIVGKQYQSGCSTEEREICGERLMREFLCMCVLVKRQFFWEKELCERRI